MRNKYFVKAHISEAEFKRILRLFCLDKTAVEIAERTEISRITVNKYLGIIRTVLMNIENGGAEEDAGKVLVKRLLKSEKRRELDRSRLAALAAIRVEGRRLRIYPIGVLPRRSLVKIATGEIQTKNEAAFLNFFCGIVDMNERECHPLPSTAEVKQWRQQKNKTDRFWDIFQSRIQKSKGISSSTLYLHLKESEVRCNYDPKEIYSLVLDAMKMRSAEMERVM